jgi:hypothetical protein
MSDYELGHVSYRFANDERMMSVQEKYYHGIVKLVEAEIARGFNIKELEIEKIHPKTFISIVVSNIILNLFFNTVDTDSNQRRKEMLVNLLQEISIMCLHSVDILNEKDNEVHH